MIVIVDYDGGNLQSVKNAVDRLGYASMVSDDRDVILNAEKIIFPGQGHFGASVESLRKKGLLEIIRHVANDRPFLGICVGMQLLFERSEEAIGVPGLGILRGEVKKYSHGQKLPQMGWNRIQSKEKECFDENYFYFANSYYCVPDEQKCVIASAYYGEPFACAIRKGDLLALQFHPEKSGVAGMKILNAFLKGLSC